MGNVGQELALLVDRVAQMSKDEHDPECDALFDDLVGRIGPYPPIAALEAVVKYYKENLNTILRTDIPCVLQEYGLSSAVVDSPKGKVPVSLERYYETKQGDKAVLAAWLESQGMGEIIKDTLALDKGAYDEKLDAFLHEGGYSYSRDSSINGNSLKAHIKKHLEAGGERPPEAAMSISIFTQAKITFPKPEGF